MAGISAVLLAAGESTRMQEPKALLAWSGRTLVEHQVDALNQAGVEEVLMVVGHRAQEVEALVAHQPKVQVVHNPNYALGKTTSIKVGLARVSPSAQAILLLGVDQPRPVSLLERLIQEHQRRQPLITAPTYQGQSGHPLIFSPELLPELEAITEERQGVREVYQRHRSRVHRVATETPLVLVDINTPQDYQRALELLLGA
ncbi:MAG: NTP transferase domain-containing protein [Dehalococcoidia bacterium]